MRHVLSVMSLLVLALTLRAVETPRIPVLIITGDDVKSHDWRTTTPATRDFLDQSGKFAVTVVEGFPVLEDKARLDQYALIYFMLFNSRKVPITDAAKDNLLTAVKGGKGFVVTHLASASFPGWKEWGEMCGRYWQMGKSGHGPRAPFDVRIVAKDDPITKGLDGFKADDELYAKLLGDAPITVLAETDSDWSKRTEPMAFTRTFGQGRVFQHTFGHDVKSLDNAPMRKLIIRGCEWAATGRVTD